jgi:hypothetical protein
MLGSDPLFDALIDLSPRRRHDVELAFSRLRLRLRPQALPALQRVLPVRAIVVGNDPVNPLFVSPHLPHS